MMISSSRSLTSTSFGSRRPDMRPSTMPLNGSGAQLNLVQIESAEAELGGRMYVFRLALRELEGAQAVVFPGFVDDAPADHVERHRVRRGVHRAVRNALFGVFVQRAAVVDDLVSVHQVQARPALQNGV